jgi:hypothetical protein
MNWFRATPAEIIDQAIARAAKLQAEKHQLFVTIDYYSTLLDRCDPHTDWWRFADLKQKHHDACVEYEFIRLMAEKAAGDADALVAADGGE